MTPAPLFLSYQSVDLMLQMRSYLDHFSWHAFLTILRTHERGSCDFFCIAVGKLGVTPSDDGAGFEVAAASVVVGVDVGDHCSCVLMLVMGYFA